MVDRSAGAAPLGLEREMTYVARTTNPLCPTKGSPFGSKQYWQVSEASLEGPRLLGAGHIEYAVHRVT